MKIIKKTLLRSGIATIAATGLLAASALAASAHVTIAPDTTEEGAYALLTVSVPHGCGSSPTHEVAIQVPEDFTSVTPTINSGWDVEIVTEELDEPISDGHGGELTERVAEIVYTADEALAPDMRDAFVLSAQLPESAGDTLYFPTVQTCADGEDAWVEIPADGDDGNDLELPAPAFEITASSAADGATPVVSWIALGAGIIGLVLAAAAFVRARGK